MPMGAAVVTGSVMNGVFGCRAVRSLSQNEQVALVAAQMAHTPLQMLEPSLLRNVAPRAAVRKKQERADVRAVARRLPGASGDSEDQRLSYQGARAARMGCGS